MTILYVASDHIKLVFFFSTFLDDVWLTIHRLAFCFSFVFLIIRCFLSFSCLAASFLLSLLACYFLCLLAFFFLYLLSSFFTCFLLSLLACFFLRLLPFFIRLLSYFYSLAFFFYSLAFFFLFACFLFFIRLLACLLSFFIQALLPSFQLCFLHSFIAS